MKKIYLSLLTIAFSYVLNAQCTAVNLYPFSAVTPTAAWTDVDACNYAGEYALVNVIAGNIYEFSTCAANGSTITFDTELTLRTNTGALIAYSDDYCGTQSYVSWTATYTGQVQIHLHTYPCGSNSICSNIRMKVTSSVPAPIPANNDCVNASNLPVNANCVLTSGTTIGATEDLIPDPSCDPGSINDVWYTFNSGAYTSINITVNLVTASWIGIEMFTACGTLAPGISLGGNLGNCDFNTSTPNPTVVSGLTPNTVYRFRLFTNVTYDIAGSFTVCLTTPPPPTVTVSSSTICAGGSATITATPSVAGGTYLWSNGATTSSITVTPGTTTNYSVTYTYNGVATNSGVVTVNPAPAISAGNDLAICSGDQATLSGTGGVSYSWDNGISNGIPFTPLATATYTVTATDANGCTNTDQVLVTVNPIPTVNGGIDQSVCAGGSATLSGSGASTYTWSGGVTNGVAFIPTVTTTYTVTGTSAAGCVGTDQVTINVTAGPVAAIAGGAAVCLGNQVTLTASPIGATYLWMPGGATTQTLTVSPTSTTSYTLTVSLPGCGSSNATQSVTVNPLPTVNAGIDQSTCAGGTVTLSGSGGTTYSWDNSVSNGVAFTPLSTATYTVTATDANGCTNTDQVIVTVNPNPTVNGGNDQTVCVGGTATLSGSGASTYTWSGGVTNGVAFTPTVTSTYTVTGTSAAGCVGTDQVTINVTAGPVAAIAGGAAVCLGNQVTLTASPVGATYLWMPGGATTQTLTVSPTSTTSYTLTVSLPGCGSSNATQSVTVNPLPTVNAGIDQSTCAGGTVTLSGSGGTTYSWDNSVSNGVAFTPLATATYTVSTTNANGCTNTDQVLVTVNPIPTVNGGNDQTVCVGGTATLSGSGASTYTWSGGVTNGVAFTPTVTSTYTVTGTSTAGCVGTDQVTINVTAGPVAAISGAAPMCLGSQVTLTASPVGVSYLWMPGGATTQTITVSPTSTTTYTLTVSLAGCGSSNATQSVVVNPAPTANFTGEACETYTWFGSTYTQSGTYTHLVPSPVGCDSVLYLNLTIHNNVVGNTEVVAACDSYQWNGQTYTQSGIYTFNGLTIHDCDSSATIDLTINSAPTASITANGNTLSTTQVAGETYAWLDCATNTLIPNETAISYTPSTSGSYAVIATNSCGIDTSFCEDMIVGITDLNLEQISIYPNPSNGHFVISSSTILVGDASIFDASGRLIKTVPLNAKENPINMLGSCPGIYITKIKGDNFSKSIRFIIQ
jgi:uncharacterized membrane-anchored protein